MMLLTLITMPSATSVIADMSEYATAFFSELLVFALAVAGIIVGILLLKKLAKAGVGGVRQLVGGGRRGGRRGRR